ncbi:MAG TPA: DinB family protein [Gemmatimonadales bacterium]|nr:DinB family protein [Gemmatimonadales bacterium]
MRASAYALAAALCAVPALARAQNPVSDAYRMFEDRSARIIVEAVESFPADKFNYRPTPAQMSVAAVAVHLVEEGNYLLCSRATGVAEPQRTKVDTTSSREALLAALRASFDFCHSSAASLTDGQLADSVPGFGPRKFTRANYVLITVGDWEDHYSQLSNYLRLNGMVPPTARRGQM